MNNRIKSANLITIWFIWTFAVDVLALGYGWNMTQAPMRTIVLIGMIFKLMLDGIFTVIIDSYRRDIMNGYERTKEETKSNV